jgi:ParB family transcriptional regulator, chromosome partitioning protein
MSTRKLGRGLDMLIAREEAKPEASPEGSEVLSLDPQRIRPNPEQPRKQFSMKDLEELRASIAREGILQPLLVRKVADGFQLVAGERRLRAARELGLDRVPAIQVAVGEDRLLELALIENLQREDLNPIEVANAYRQLMEVKGWTQESLAAALGLSRPSIANTVRLLELPEDIQGSVVRGHITAGHAKLLLAVTDPREQRLLFERIAEEKLTVRDLEMAVEESADKKVAAGDSSETPRRGRKARGGDKRPHLVSLEERFSERLGTRVRIREKNGKGRISIDFFSADEFERIQEIILK